MKLTLKRLAKIIETACKEGQFHDDYLFEYEPHVADKLYHDRQTAVAAIEFAISKLHPRSGVRLKLMNTLERMRAGWPKEEADS